MAKKRTLSDVLDEIKSDVQIHSMEREIPDIITFCDDEEWLALPLSPTNPINLYPMQRIMLKAFYRGTRGNENLKLTDEEMQLCCNLGLIDDNRGNVIGKYESGELFNELILVWGRRCISEDTGITNIKDGSLNRVGDLWDKGIREISSWTFDEEKNKMICIEGAEIIYQGERQCYNLTTSSGHEIEVTENHPFLTERGWVKLGDLHIEEDKVAICEEDPFFGNSREINEDEAVLLGYMTADGNCSQSSTFFTCNDKEILEDFTDKLDKISDNLKIFNDPWTGEKSKKNQYKITSVRYENETFFKENEGRNRVRRAKNDLSKLLEKWGLRGKTCHHKIVPLELFKCPKNVIAKYLRALFSCDGNLGTRSNVTFEFITVNKEQAKLIQKLLHKFGIISHLRKKKVVSKIIDEKEVLKEYNTFCYIVYFSRKKYVQTFLNEIGFIGKEKYIQRALIALNSIDENTKTTHNDNHPFSFYKIKNIELIGNKHTFDISVANDSEKNKQNFVANNFVVHNSGKDFLVSIIALYEAMKLLEIPGGDPYAYYEIAPDNTINITTIANAKSQASIAFDAIKSKLFTSTYFKDKFIPDGITKDSIFLLTPQDKKNNKERKGKGLSPEPGSIGILVGHSNSDTLLGQGCMVLLLDEVASYKATGGSSSGDRIYTALTPTVRTYIRKTYQKDKDGNFVTNHREEKVIVDRQYDGKVISISSPRAQEGKFYELFKTTKNFPARLTCRLATWDVNITHTKESLRNSETSMSENEFMMEYGAEFSGAAMEYFFTEEQVNLCFDNHPFEMREMGEPGRVYFAHLDPATSSHNYALVILHKEFYLNKETQKTDFIIIVDHVKFWEPGPGKPIDVDVVDDYVVKLKRRFHIGMMTYDQMNSSMSILRLRKAGIPNKMTRFTHMYKNQIYKELENAVNANKLKIPYHHHLKQEMLELQRRFVANGFKVSPKKDGDGVKTDDICDSLAGSLYIAVNKYANKLPTGKTVDMGTFASSNQIAWRNMQGGVYGYGTGQQVASSLEKRASWPDYKRFPS